MLEDFRGIEDKKITVRSTEGSTHMLTWPNSSDTVELKGDVTFENVHISPKTLYAQGHHLTLGEGFGGGEDGQKRMIVYGGSDRDLTTDTHLTITDGVYKLIAGGNSAGTLTGDTHVEFGGNARFPDASDGADSDTAYVDGTTPGVDDPKGGDRRVVENSEHYNLFFNSISISEFNPVMVTVYKQGYLAYGIYGGGIGGNVSGSTNVTMTGGKVFQIFGGGAAIKAPSLIENNLGKVGGDTNVTVTGGEVKSVYGGGFNDLQSLLDNSDQTGDDVVATDDLRDSRAAVAGSTYVVIAGNAHVPDATRPQWSTSGSYDLPGVYGGSFHSSVKSTHVTVGGSALIETRIGSVNDYGVVWGGGCSDKVRGTTHVELTGNARIGNDQNGLVTIGGTMGGTVTPLGRSADSRTYFGSVPFYYGADILNENDALYAATAVVSGGHADVLTATHKRTPKVENTTSVHGSIQLMQTGGFLQTIEAGGRSDKKVAIMPSADRSPVDVVISGGTVSRYIMGRYPSNSSIGHAELMFDACGGETSYIEVPNIIYFDSIAVKSAAYIAARPEFTHGPIKKTAFTEVGNLTIEQGGFLALLDNASIGGDLKLDGSLHLVKTGFLAPKPRTLTAAGKAAGTGELRVIAKPASNTDYSQFKKPKAGEECVYATAKGSDMALGLANPEPELFVNRKNNSDTQDVWFIDELIPQQVTVTFDKNGGDTEADPMSMTVTSGSTVGTLPTEPTRANYTFLGWNTKADGSGDSFTADTPVTADITVYAQWEAVPEQLWFYALYYQLYTPDGAETDENGLHYDWIGPAYGQGGWAYPNDTVTISSSKFDGKQFNWDAIDGSGKETLGIHYVYDENFGPHRLSATCAEATKSNPLRIYYRAAPHKVTYEYLGAVPDGAPEPPSESQAPYSSPVDVKPNPTLAGYQFSGWEVQTPAGTEITDGKLTMPSKDVMLTGTWTKLPIPPVPEEKIGNLTISKTVLGNGGETNRDFHFTLALSDRSINGVFGDVSFSNGVADITLKHRESKTAAGLPAGLNYEVAEAEANQDSYTTTSTGETGTIIEGTTRSVFTNSRNTVEPGPGPSAKVGNLTVSKTVTGDKADTSRNFTFSVILDDASINGIYGDMEFRNGVATITLAHGESKTATGLPAGIDYLVEEEECPDYTITKTGDAGTIEANATALASFTNQYKNNGSVPDPDPDPDNPNTPSEPDSPAKPDKPSKPNGELPQTGDAFAVAPILAFALTGAIAVVAGIKYASTAKKRP